MFRIRRIHDDALPVNCQAIAEVRDIFLEHFAGAPISDMDNLGEKLRNPFMQRFRMVLYVAENSKGRISGFATVLHEPELQFSYLDYLAVSGKTTGRGEVEKKSKRRFFDLGLSVGMRYRGTHENHDILQRHRLCNFHFRDVV